ncbi:hypothetical protein ACH5RR_010133 [Cinchona calisaya]|uniref:Uncharacterized protein n=1 Tax=Cinchona calisaya TaxID=153742 RepID=A0ABD3AG92_9GENT
MASHERERLLPSELFQGEDHDVFSEYNNNNNNNIMVSPKGWRSFESNFSSCGSTSAYSSWSDFSSPVSSELGSSTSETVESEDEELFISELSRQMAESMLQDDDDDDDKIQDHQNITLSENSETSEPKNVCCYNSQEIVMGKSENPTSDSDNQVSKDDDQLRQVQVYELKNQPHMRKQQGGCGGYGGRRVNYYKATESTQLREHQNMHNKAKAWRYGHGKKSSSTLPVLPSPPGGSGMRAFFLGGSERNGSSGTGVFLPSGAYATPEPKRKSGCSTVLIPARVLQTLQQHFNTVGSPSPSNATRPWQNDVLTRINGLLSQQKERAEFQTPPAPAAAEINHQPEVQLPQEWTY